MENSCFLVCLLCIPAFAEVVNKADNNDGKCHCRDHSPDQDVGCTPAGCVGSEEDREGDDTHEDREYEDRYCDLDYGPAHGACFDLHAFKHIESPLKAV